jgi:uncharacterized membrane protein
MSASATLIVIVFSFIGVGTTFFGFISYWAGKNKRFDYYAFGIKTHSTRSNPEIWAVVSKDAGLAFMLEGIATLIVTIVFREFFVRHNIAIILTFSGVSIVIALLSAFRASKMARADRLISFSSNTNP